MGFSRGTPSQFQVQLQLQQHQHPPIRPSNSTQSLTPKHNNISLRQSHKQVVPIIPWTTSIARHSKNGNLSAAFNEFNRMRLSGIHPNHITFITLLSAIAHYPSQAKHFALPIHAYLRKLALNSLNVKVGTALVDMYSKCGFVHFARLCFDEIFDKNSLSWNTMIDCYMKNGKVDDALQLFDEMPIKDVVSWTVLIGGFVKKGLDDKALDCFYQMLLSGVDPDYVTIIAVLSACANLGALTLGLWIHRFVMGKEFKDNIRLCNTLIEMYSRCGRVDFAHQVFDNMPTRTLVSWNTMLGGFAANGHAEEALKLFETMQIEGFKPDGVSFTGALTACSHAGLVDQGLIYFEDMQRVYNLSPRIEHYGCLVDLYSRAGRLENALNVIKNMPMKPNEVVLGSLLAACRDCGDIGLAEVVMKYIVELDPSSDSNYVMLANMYAAIGSWEGANKVRRKMKTRGIQKRPGVSSIEIEGSIHEFMASNKSHSETDSIYEILKLLSYELENYGYVREASKPEL
ncbi:pentatricopeptide repeat-containing protein At1g05750, chloroplastic-like [Chenopodium quinoa]|nr:pentatricopeptide repeat-containing protein At1g05750, chloroplastic-like [Chenopodium quinoa]